MFGCPGGQYGSPNVCLNITKKVALIILMPLVLYFGAAGMAIYHLCYDLRHNCDCHPLFEMLTFILLIFPLSLVAGALACVLTPFAILVQFYLLMKIVFKMLS